MQRIDTRRSSMTVEIDLSENMKQESAASL